MIQVWENKLSIYARLVQSIKDVGAKIPADVTLAVDVAMMLQKKSKTLRAADVRDFGAQLRRERSRPDRTAQIEDRMQELREAVVLREVATLFRQDVRNAQHYAVTLIKQRAPVELIDALKPPFQALVDELVPLVGKYPEVAAHNYMTVARAHEPIRQAFLKAYDLTPRIEHIRALATKIEPSVWALRDKVQYISDWDPDTVGKDLTLRLRGDPYAVSSGGAARPVPTTLEIIAAGGVPRLLNVPEFKAAIEAHIKARAEAKAERARAAGMRLVPVGVHGW